MRVLVIDTETANTIEQPLPYDIGYAIVDTETGEILLERSFAVAEIFFDKDLMKNAYFAEKIPQYWEKIKKHKIQITSLCKIRRTIRKDMKDFQISKVGAYNMSFDNRATKNDTRYITGSLVRWFFPYGTELFCIWNMACSSILSTIEYINFALENNFVSEKGNIQTSAEKAYCFITNNPHFEESHTGLEDVKIEIKILLAVINSGLSFDDKIYSACWQKVQKFRKEIDLC